MAVAFAATLCVSRLGSVINFFTSSLICNKIGLVNTMWYAFALCMFSALFVVLFCFIDYFYNKDHPKSSAPKPKCKEIMKFRVEFWLLCILCGTIYSFIYPFVAVAK